MTVEWQPGDPVYPPEPPSTEPVYVTCPKCWTKWSALDVTECPECGTDTPEPAEVASPLVGRRSADDAPSDAAPPQPPLCVWCGQARAVPDGRGGVEWVVSMATPLTCQHEVIG